MESLNMIITHENGIFQLTQFGVQVILGREYVMALTEKQEMELEDSYDFEYLDTDLYVIDQHA